MCRIEERIYIDSDGRRRIFEDNFLCENAHRGKLCSKVKKKTTEYFSKQPQPAISRDDASSSLSSNNPPTPPAGTGSYLVEERRPSKARARPSAKDSKIVIEFGASKKDGKSKSYSLIAPPNIAKKRSSPGATFATSDEVAIESSGSDASYTIRTGFPEIAVPPPNHQDESQGSWHRHDLPKSHHRRVPSSSSDTRSSQPPSLYAPVEPKLPSNSLKQLPRYPRTVLHNPSPNAAPSSPNASRATAPASPSYRTTPISPRTALQDNTGASPPTPLDHFYFADKSASSDTGLSRAAAPEITERAADRESRRLQKEDWKKRQEEADRRSAEEWEKIEPKGVRFELGSAAADRAKQRAEQRLAESEKRRAEERDYARQRKKEQDKRLPTKAPEHEKTKPPTREPTRRRSRWPSLPQADIDELNRLRLETKAHIAREREFVEQRERDEQAMALRQRQQTSDYWDPRRGEQYPFPNTSPNTSTGAVVFGPLSRRRISVSEDSPPAGSRGRSNSTRLVSIAQAAPPASPTPNVIQFTPQQHYFARSPSPKFQNLLPPYSPGSYTSSTSPNAPEHESDHVGLIPADPALNRETDGETTQENSQEIKTRQGEVEVDDTRSEISSNGLGSVFSIASWTSLTSAITDLSRDTGYSAAHIENATSNLLSMLEVDEVLTPLYVAAIQDASIGPQRFENNFRRLLKLYAGRLKEEAHDSLEYLAAGLVLSKARTLAEAIVEKYRNQPSPQDAGKDSVMKDTVRQPEELSEDEEDVTSYEGVLEDLAKVRKFWSGSDAFLTLRAELTRFVGNTEKSTAESQPVLLGQADITQKSQTPERAQWFFAALLRLYHFPLLHRGQKSPCPPGIEQIEWQCKCGVRGFGEVRETRPGGVSKLKAHMKRATGTTFRSHDNSHSGSQSALSFRDIWQSFREAIRSMTHSDPTLPTSNRPNQPQTTSQSLPDAINVQGRNLILMSCLHRGETAKDLYQDNIGMLSNDRSLMYFLKERYRMRRGKFRSAISMRKVIGIHFTQFLLSVSKNVEVRYHAKCCTSQACECLPPLDLVDPTGTDPQYQYAPVPPATLPPYVPDYLLHLFNSPSCIDENEEEVFERLPKRTKGEIAGTRSQRAKGWGIFYEEGWDQSKIAWLVFLVMFLGSFLFGVLWAAFRKDVQSAFSISAWWVTIGGSAIALFAISSSRV